MVFCGFNLNFPIEHFYVLIGYSDIFLCEVSDQLFCPHFLLGCNNIYFLIVMHNIHTKQYKKDAEFKGH